MSVFNKKQASAQSVDIWQCSLILNDAERLRYWRYLTTNEQRKADAQINPQQRDKIISGRGQLRDILANYLDIPAADIEISINEYGKPYLAKHQLYFNLSHSAERMVVAVSSAAEVGVDIERISKRQKLYKLAQRCFSAQEFAQWQEFPEDARQTLFYQLWTHKEALVKAVGRGLALGLNCCEFDLQNNLQLCAIPTAYGPTNAWQVSEFVSAQGFISAVALRANELTLNLVEKH